MSEAAVRPETRRAEKSVGERVNSKVGRKLVMGNGQYAPDVNLPGMLHARFVRSPHGHARIVNIDATRAREMPGVELVWTAEDIDPYVRPFGHPSLDTPDETVLAADRVRYVGDEVAVVLAKDQNTAIEAAEAVEVEYERLPAVTTVEAALADDAPLLHPDLDADPDCSVHGNILGERDFVAGDVDAAFEEAEVVIEERFETNKTTPAPMEPHGCVASYNVGSGELEIWSSNQAPHTLPQHLDETIIALDAADVKARMPDVGGAFGVKGGHEIFSHEICAAVLSMVAERPVQLLHDRIESMQAGRGRHPETLDARLAVAADGTMLGWDIDLYQNTGAYGSYGKPVAASGAVCGSGPYLLENQRLHATVVYTNVMPGTAVRGFGDPQFAFMREQLVDMAAEELGMDPIELRLRNVPRKEDMPLRSPMDLKWNSGDMPACIDRVCEMINWGEHHGGSRTRDGKLRGVGLGLVMRRCGNKEVEGSDYESAIVRMDKFGNVTVYSGIANVGQGTETALCQIVADVLGVPFDRVTPIVGDSEVTPDGMGVWADRGAIFGGSAAAKAAEDLKAKIVRLAAHLLDADAEAIELADDRVFESGNPDNGMDVPEFADIAFFGDPDVRPEDMRGGVSLIGEAKFESLEEEILDKETGRGNLSHTYSFGALAALVDVDLGTGEVEVVDIAACEDAGTLINPKLVEGQSQGGAVQALGETLLENYHYEPDGALTNGTFIDYHLPTAADVPMITKLDSVETPDPTTSHGQKGVGEFSIVPVGAAVANAVYDATGIRFTSLPLSPSRVLPALVEAGLREL